VGFGFEGLGPYGFVWVSSCELVWLIMCIIHVYLWAPYAFFNKTFFTHQKKKKKVCFNETKINFLAVKSHSREFKQKLQLNQKHTPVQKNASTKIRIYLNLPCILSQK